MTTCHDIQGVKLGRKGEEEKKQGCHHCHDSTSLLSHHGKEHLCTALDFLPCSVWNDGKALFLSDRMAMNDLNFLRHPHGRMGGPRGQDNKETL